jgi:hypothetical protein
MHCAPDGVHATSSSAAGVLLHNFPEHERGEVHRPGRVLTAWWQGRSRATMGWECISGGAVLIGRKVCGGWRGVRGLHQVPVDEVVRIGPRETGVIPGFYAKTMYSSYV